MPVSKKRVRTKRTTLNFFVRNGERFPLLLETNNAFKIFTQTYFNSEQAYDRFLCSQSLHGIVKNQEKDS